MALQLILVKTEGTGVPASIITSISFMWDGPDAEVAGTDGTDTYDFGDSGPIFNGDTITFTAANAALSVFEPILRLNQSGAGGNDTVDIDMLDPVSFTVSSTLWGGKLIVSQILT